MDKPVRASDTPLVVHVDAGKAYFWCACGRSSKQPFCDGSHKDTGFAPFKFTPSVSGKVTFCCCKGTRNQPYCDGSHKTAVE